MKLAENRLLQILACWMGLCLLLSSQDVSGVEAFISRCVVDHEQWRNDGFRGCRLLHAEGSSVGDETKQLIEAQQKQIDKLLKIVSDKAPIQNSSTDDFVPFESSRTSLPPLKVMLFIDGTWLYYSLHTRDEAVCPIQKEFGVGWQRSHGIDWGVLPRVIGQALQQQDKERGWMPASDNQKDQGGRPVEIVRVSVYTSFRPDTPKTSLRYQMFQDMINAKYDVLMLETIGHNEKCVDIQLAVDMLHYATVPDAYDVAVLVSGDKDFVPAMVRTRQKGRRVALASVRGYSATRAFYETPNIKDFDVVWIDDYLDQIIQAKSVAPHLKGNRPGSTLSPYTMMKVVADFVQAFEAPLVSSRDVGRYIKSKTIADRNMLTEVKEIYGGLYQFLIVSGIFIVDASTTTRNFSVGLKEKERVEEGLDEAKNQTKLSKAEKDFFATYSTRRLQNKGRYYEFTIRDLHGEDDPAIILEKPDYGSLLVSELKEICRERGLKVSGKKSELLDRIVTDDEEGDHATRPSRSGQHPETSEYLESLLLEYLHAKGGHASSRDVGRYLTANKPSYAILEDRGINSALAELKETYGSVRQFISESPRFSEEVMEEGDNFEFLVRATAV